MKKPPQLRIINPPVHVNNTHRIDHLVAGKATGGDAVEPAKGIEGRVPFFQLGLPIRGVAPLAPGIKAEFR